MVIFLFFTYYETTECKLSYDISFIAIGQYLKKMWSFETCWLRNPKADKIHFKDFSILTPENGCEHGSDIVVNSTPNHSPKPLPH